MTFSTQLAEFCPVVLVAEALPGGVGPAALAGRADRHENRVVPHVAQVQPAQLPLLIVAPEEGELAEWLTVVSGVQQAGVPPPGKVGQ